MKKCIVYFSALALLSAAWGRAAVMTYPMDLAGFDLAAGSPPIAVDFDSIAPGTDITGQTLAGATLWGPGAPLIVVKGSDTYTPVGFSWAPNPATNKLYATSGENVLSPGGVVLGPGPNSPVEDDDLTLVFASPVSAFGFDHLSQSADGFSYTNIAVYDVADGLLYSGVVPISGVGGDGPGAADFWGIVSDSANIAKIVIDETDANAEFPDCNIGVDTLRFVPEPGAFVLLGAGTVSLVAVAWRRRTRRMSRLPMQGCSSRPSSS